VLGAGFCGSAATTGAPVGIAGIAPSDATVIERAPGRGGGSG
jgi:hypothetical protein